MIFTRKGLCLSASLILLIQVSYSRDGIKQQEDKKNKLEQEIAQIDQYLKITASKEKNALEELSLLSKKIDKREELIKETENQIAAINTQIILQQKTVDSLQTGLNTFSEYYYKLILSAYKNRDSKIKYLYILSSENMGQAYRRIKYLKNMAEHINRLAEDALSYKKELELQTENLLKIKESQIKEQAKREQELTRLMSEKQNSRAIIDKLTKDKTKYKKDLAQKQKEVKRLNIEIERLIREASKKTISLTKKKDKKVISSEDLKLHEDFVKNKGKLPWPVSGTIIDGFGQRFHPVFKNVKLPYNNGINIATDKDAAVKAVFDGIIRQIVIIPGYNQCILVQHGNYFSFYCKMGKVSVKAGDKVRTGQILGNVATDNETPQLHLQIWEGNKPQNPEVWLR